MEDANRTTPDRMAHGRDIREKGKAGKTGEETWGQYVGPPTVGNDSHTSRSMPSHRGRGKASGSNQPA
ncbi:hypothetical protein ROR02_21680 [Pararhodospirillum oryzae]|uniref:Uncharacterized protein n=1 Tax=Pararhodospirillum oryzae TaxID=478448 RepID=A0A512H9A1_9PROT|nr:hypothetical protein ROR02_21680 [Pararhodospirillum oryzae]